MNISSLILLPNELKVNILKFLDIRDLENCRLVCKGLSPFVEERYKEIAKVVGFSIDSFANAREAVMRQFSRLKGHWSDESNRWKVIPTPINRILNSFYIPTIEEIISMLKNTVMFDKIQVWKHLQESIGQKVANDDFEIMDKLDKKVGEFEQWYPKNAEQLKTMPILNIMGKNIHFLPNIIGELTNLVSLNLGFSKIYEFPKVILNLTKLKTIKLGSNEIKKIPEEIERLSNLEHLDLSWNKLTKLPTQFWNLSKLNFLDLCGNYLNLDRQNFELMKKINEITHFYFYPQRLQGIKRSQSKELAVALNKKFRK